MMRISLLSCNRPDWKACETLAAATVNISATKPCSPQPCALGTPQPPADATTFYALTGATSAVASSLQSHADRPVKLAALWSSLRVLALTVESWGTELPAWNVLGVTMASISQIAANVQGSTWSGTFTTCSLMRRCLQWKLPHAVGVPGRGGTCSEVGF